jgi:hypothetical protein
MYWVFRQTYSRQIHSASCVFCFKLSASALKSITMFTAIPLSLQVTVERKFGVLRVLPRSFSDGLQQL